jgi:hypothetical protein
MQDIPLTKNVSKSLDQQKKKPEITDYFYKGCYLDVRERGSNYWNVALVISIDKAESQIRISYDGLSSKYDEVITFLVITKR